MYSNLSLIARPIKTLGDFREMKRQPMPPRISRVAGQVMPKSSSRRRRNPPATCGLPAERAGRAIVHQQLNPRHVGLQQFVQSPISQKCSHREWHGDQDWSPRYQAGEYNRHATPTAVESAAKDGACGAWASDATRGDSQCATSCCSRRCPSRNESACRRLRYRVVSAGLGDRFPTIVRHAAKPACRIFD